MLNDYSLAILFFAAALLYSTVGHAGASGYLAAMALFGTMPAVMRPTALMLNILVATIATVRFARAGCFSWRLFWPFAALSVPLAYVGGALTLPDPMYKQIVGAVLLYAAYRLFRHADDRQPVAPRPPHPMIALPVGGAIGLLSGLTGVGGGIFLSPLILLMKWADARVTAGVSAAFILANSIAGLAGQSNSAPPISKSTLLWATSVVAGGAIGSQIGARKLAGPTIRRLLAVVLVIAGMKMLIR